ncbi:MAG: hypothetical protein F6J93_27145 [Oscillatoria sp. SIO1A7]|nr:hypothetical protein [Oscillatoria sp. SIO1A7]
MPRNLPPMLPQLSLAKGHYHQLVQAIAQQFRSDPTGNFQPCSGLRDIIPEELLQSDAIDIILRFP